MKRLPLLTLALAVMTALACTAEMPGQKSGGAQPSAVTKTANEDLRTDSRDVPRVRTIQVTSGTNTLWLTTSKTYSVLRSNDGGESWITSTVPAAISGAYWVYFYDAKLGWIVDGAGAIWKSLDGGNTWVKKFALRESANDTNFIKATGMFFRTAEQGWIFGVHGAFYTEDGGERWSKIKSFPFSIEHIESVGSDHLWILGTHSDNRTAFVSRSVDAGQRWSTHKVARECTATAISFRDPNVGYVTCSFGELYRTADGGSTWHRESLDDRFGVRSVSWTSSDVGWAAGFVCEASTCLPGSAQAKLLRTQDAGKSWTEVLVPNNRDPFFDRVLFLDERTGWLVSRDNIYKTTDGGLRWRLLLAVPW
jgi:photosystem II stability/assembly factor-like uncharacterized protein